MKKYLWLLLVLSGFLLSYRVLADEVAEKTDGSFVGENPPKPINSSFVGDISNSMANYSAGDNVQEHTDGEFVGANTIKTDYPASFAGDSYQEQVGNSTVAPFAGDGTFVGKDYGK